jgi:hypothetical protein
MNIRNINFTLRKKNTVPYFWPVEVLVHTSHSSCDSYTGVQVSSMFEIFFVIRAVHTSIMLDISKIVDI